MKTLSKPPITDSLLSKIVSALLSIDPDIVAVVLFGSAVYAPDLARDIDLLVISKAPKERERYEDAVLEASQGWDVDLVVHKVGETAGRLRGAIRAFGRILFGEENRLSEVVNGMPIPSFRDAWRALRRAERLSQAALQETDLDEQDDNWRDAFNWLFEAARRAAMAFLNTDETRWGALRGQLPQPFQDEFRAIANTSHIRFWYEGDYPHDNPEWHFQTWRDRVAQFISDLEQAAAQKQP
jgi:predicted nucleotidyltransferase